ncbi:MAG: FtsX-like permease family protein [Chloroflexi bacterium]|nr:MAG: FtsX-like permease family protein [Chloroflexota bacterium]
MAEASQLSASKAPVTKNSVGKVPTVQQAPKRAFAQNSWHSKPRRGVKIDAILGSALEALQANRMRSFLTMLGVIIGVSAVIAVVSLTQGVNQSVSQRFSSLGTNVITISPGAASTDGARGAAGTQQTLTMSDAQAVAQLDHVVAMTPILTTSGQVVYGNQNWNTGIRGVYPNYQTIQSWQIAEGSWFSNGDEQVSAPVAVLGQTVVQNLFSSTGTDPIGQTVLINNQAFHVVGTLQAKGSQGFANVDDVIFVPFGAVNERLKPSPVYVDQIQVQVDDVNNVAQVQQNITTLLRTRHHLRGSAPSSTGQQFGGGNVLGGLGGGGNGGRGFGGGGNGGRGGGNTNGGQQTGGSTTPGSNSSLRGVPQANNFQVFSGNQLVQTAQQNTAELAILLIGIAAVSLSVGGIGIMNIMLVSVAERTREIGVRMAIGARQRDIRNQFLLEALMLSVIGGIIGIVVGLLGGFGLTTSLGFPFVFSIIAVVLAFGVSAVVGISFGLYPAVRAAKLDPIVALRME